ncbi:16S rRNA (cytosine(1402)-N(4))-methyltransferase RsmH [Candidatus Liberibacter sp.]|uniref:16S rRNA (cytosine(1402)-N(4))-methyltransferase RsmH n=1 Tax=Candidatus Liberibacter sp. TaxID=34022 RepID=UPI0015F5E715|nr:16S rRNA (cytosine(1402)-N(4))-methyltransferase RsmH [Candidatus Liberibacter sp.]MBA5724063.1 16S rRNA (cytosine(1402)-N(4))-methyltransferase RsmH [Candidatus Liberibacter sp.]
MESGCTQSISSSSVVKSAENHVPVLLSKVISLINPSPGKTILDATFGAGGYSRSFCEKGANVIALDRDPLAVSKGKYLEKSFEGKFSLLNANFSQLDKYVPADGVDAIVFDLGVSSMQIDNAERGFSFQKDGPLDMRMSCDGISASDVVNHTNVNDLSYILNILGEEKQASRIARAIVKHRQVSPFRTTGELSSLIQKISHFREKYRIHPATRSFQALRIFVNNELEELAQGLLAAEKVLGCDGILVVVSFHSLEDRIVKNFFSSRAGKVSAIRHMLDPRAHPAVFKLLTKKVIVPTQCDIDTNRRARSAKLRVGIRTFAPPMPRSLSFMHLPQLPLISQVRIGHAKNV